jgi:prepilin-type N-terminal cleavage/methylation domain-containing protein
MSHKTNNQEYGFTIVELLVVIVVIGILAAITIVSYTGVQNRARTVSAQSYAQEAQNKAEIYASDTGNGIFPTMTELTSTTGSAMLSPKVSSMLSASAPTANTQTTVLQYIKCTTAIGAKVGYWDSAATTPAVVYLLAGAATNPTTATC